jgi:HD-GYP domain-containing protein (c-di-GMP phosphodiesterase class II)
MCALDARDTYTGGHSQRVSSMAVEICQYHHERYDGKGYPKGRKGVDIPMGARIVAICDSIDAMTSNRCYRKAHSLEYCYREIEKNLGKMYDPVLGSYVLEHWDHIVKIVENNRESA